MPAHIFGGCCTDNDGGNALVQKADHDAMLSDRPKAPLGSTVLDNVGKPQCEIGGDCSVIRSLTSELQDMVSEELSRFCPLCFRHSLQRPVLLHSSPHVRVKAICLACEECAVRWHKLSLCSKGVNTLRCPQCDELLAQTEMKIPFTGEVSGVIVNCATSDNKGCNTGKSGGETADALCGICEETSAMNYCVPCGFPLCESCEASFHQRGQYREHEVVPLRVAQHKVSRVCREHPVRPLELYCFTCSLCVCITCCFDGRHKGHSVEPLEGVARKMYHAIEEEANQLQKLNEGASALARDFQKHLLPYERGITLVQDEIRDCFDSLREALTHREQQLQRELLDHASRVKSEVARQVSRCTEVQTNVQHMVSSVDQFFTATEIADIAHLGKVVRASIGALSRASAVTLSESSDACRGMDRRLNSPGFVASFATPTKEECLKHISSLGHMELLDTLGWATVCKPTALQDVEYSDVTEKQPLVTLSAADSFPHEIHALNSSKNNTCGHQELELNWDSPDLKDDSSRATLPSLIVKSDVHRLTKEAAADIDMSSYKSLKMRHTLTRKHPLSSGVEGEVVVGMPPRKQPKTTTPSPVELLLPKRSTQPHGATASAGVVTNGELSASSLTSALKNETNGSVFSDTSSYLQLHF